RSIAATARRCSRRWALWCGGRGGRTSSTCTSWPSPDSAGGSAPAAAPEHEREQHQRQRRGWLVPADEAAAAALGTRLGGGLVAPRAAHAPDRAGAGRRVELAPHVAAATAALGAAAGAGAPARAPACAAGGLGRGGGVGGASVELHGHRAAIAYHRRRS